MKGSFIEARLGELPPWAAGPVGQALEAACGNDENQALGELEDVVKMFSPYTCPVDALDVLGVRFGLPRYPGEPNGTAPTLIGGPDGTGYRGRLCLAWDAWSWAGTKKAITDQLVAYGFPQVALYEAHELAFLPANPIGYNPNTSPPWYTGFVVVLGPDFGATGLGPQLSPFTAGPQCTSGSTATRNQVIDTCRIILKWKSVHSYPVGVILRFGTTAIGGINTTSPFTPSATPQYCFWNIGKLQTVNVFNAPWTPGGYAF
jgi:hypothetical protein